MAWMPPPSTVTNFRSVAVVLARQCSAWRLRHWSAARPTATASPVDFVDGTCRCRLCGGQLCRPGGHAECQCRRDRELHGDHPATSTSLQIIDDGDAGFTASGAIGRWQHGSPGVMNRTSVMHAAGTGLKQPAGRSPVWRRQLRGVGDMG